ncbi:MAG: hypothetical protein ACD_22C00259G0001, partial [uncultured bacterium]
VIGSDPSNGYLVHGASRGRVLPYNPKSIVSAKLEGLTPGEGSKEILCVEVDSTNGGLQLRKLASTIYAEVWVQRSVPEHPEVKEWQKRDSIDWMGGFDKTSVGRDPVIVNIKTATHTTQVEMHPGGYNAGDDREHGYWVRYHDIPKGLSSNPNDKPPKTE